MKAYQKFMVLKYRVLVNYVKTVLKKYDKNYDSSFKPYQVKYLYPLQSHRPRILHAIGNFVTGGSSRLVVDLIEHLGHRFEQEVITNYLPSPPSYTGLKLHAYPDPTSASKLLSYMRKFKPDILHVHYWGSSDQEWYHQVFQAAELYGCQVIENVNIPVAPYVSDVVNSYVYVSNYVQVEYGIANANNLTIYPGSDFTHFSRKNNLKLPDDCIGMVYRLDADKLNERSIDVFIKVVQQRKKTKALIVGGGYYLEYYKDVVRQAGVADSFIFTGFVSYYDLPKFYEQLSIFVAPVWKESFGQVSPFAMNMKIPVVGYNIGVLNELLEDDSLLAPPDDSDMLADIIIKLLDDREKRLAIGEKNCQRAQQLFSVEVMIGSYSRLYEEILQFNPCTNKN